MNEPTTPPHRLSKRKRAILVIMPFSMLVLCLGLLNLWAKSAAPSPTTPVTDSSITARTELAETAVPTQAAPLQSMATVTAVAPPTPAPPTPTSILLPTLPPTATLTLLGPPDNSRIMVQDAVTVYWTWPTPLAEDQYFGIYLQEENGDTRVGRLEEANFGAGYRWQTEAQYLVDGGGEVRYLIKLETILTDTPLITSEPRTLIILDTNG